MILNEDGKIVGLGHTPERSPLHPRAWKVGARDDSHQAGGMDSNANPSTPPPPRNAQSRTPGIAKVEDSAAVRGNFLVCQLPFCLPLSFLW